MYDCIVSIAEKEIRLCKNIAKFLLNLPFQLAKFCIFDAKFEIFFLQKTAGTAQDSTRVNGKQKLADCEISWFDLALYMQMTDSVKCLLGPLTVTPRPLPASKIWLSFYTNLRIRSRISTLQVKTIIYSKVM